MLLSHMVETALSENGIPIRLTDERWAHITEEHCELAGMKFDILETVAQPSVVFSGTEDELLCVREFEAGKYLVVVYREFEKDGFVITAFLTRREKSLMRRNKLWQK